MALIGSRHVHNRGFRHPFPTTHLQIGFSRPRPDQFLLAGIFLIPVSHWLLWQASLSTKVGRTAAWGGGGCLPSICGFSAWPDRSTNNMPHCRPVVPTWPKTCSAEDACMVVSQSPGPSRSFSPWSATHPDGLTMYVYSPCETSIHPSFLRPVTQAIKMLLVQLQDNNSSSGFPSHLEPMQSLTVSPTQGNPDF